LLNVAAEGVPSRKTAPRSIASPSALMPSDSSPTLPSRRTVSAAAFIAVNDCSTASPPPIIARKLTCCSACDTNSPITPSSSGMFATAAIPASPSARAPAAASADSWAAPNSPALNALTAAASGPATVWEPMSRMYSVSPSGIVAASTSPSNAAPCPTMNGLLENASRSSIGRSRVIPGSPPAIASRLSASKSSRIAADPFVSTPGDVASDWAKNRPIPICAASGGSLSAIAAWNAERSPIKPPRSGTMM
jgi:hypothetical protein